MRVLIFYRLSGDCVERRAEIGVVGRGGLDGLIGEQVGAAGDGARVLAGLAGGFFLAVQDAVAQAGGRRQGRGRPRR